MPNYKRANEIKQIISHLECEIQVAKQEINEITTGNLAHHKASLASKFDYLEHLVKEKVSPILYEERERMIDRKQPKTDRTLKVLNELIMGDKY